MHMVEDREDRLFGLCVDHHNQLLRVRQHLDLFHIQFDLAMSLEEAEDIASRRLYSLSLVRLETISRDKIAGFCSYLRSRNPLTILVVVMDCPDAVIEEHLFDSGVSDVVVLDRSCASVLAKRIRAHLHATGILQPCPKRIRLGDVLVDFDRREVRRKHAVRELPGILSDLLKYFVQNSDHVVSREELQKSPIWLDSICTPAKHGGKTFDVNVSRLRKIIEPDPSKPRIILSVRGVGWKLAPELARRGATGTNES